MKFILKNIDQIVIVIVAIVTAILGYITGRKHQLFLEKRSRLMERHQKLYAPFEKLYLKTCTGAFYFTDLPLDVQEQFLLIMYDNYEYTDSKLKNLIYDFRCNYYGNNIDTEVANLKFHEIAVQISTHFNELGEKLYFEPYDINA